MTTYARLTAEMNAVDLLLELTAEQYVALEANGKASWLRLWAVDAQPTPGATQVVEHGPIVINETEARQTWALREKTQAELDAEANSADRPTIKAAITALSADIAAYNANPDVTGTAVERLAKLEARVKELERQVRRANVILRHYTRGLL